MKSEKKILKHLMLNLRIWKDSQIPHRMLGPNALCLFNLFSLTLTSTITLVLRASIYFQFNLHVSKFMPDVSLALTILFLLDVYLTFLWNISVTEFKYAY